MSTSARSAGGILFALGNWTNGCAWYLLDGTLVHVFNGFGNAHRIVADRTRCPRARTICRTRIRAKAAAARGSSRSTVGEVGRGELPHDLPFRWQIGSAGLTIGADRGFPVCDDYTVPFRFTGTLHDVTFDDPDARAEGRHRGTRRARHRAQVGVTPRS